MPNADEIRKSIRDRLAELEREQARLEAALAALGPARRGRPPGAQKKSSRKG